MSELCPHGYLCGRGCPAEYCKGWRAAADTAVNVLEGFEVFDLADDVRSELCTPR